jgi:hypothetical protein
MEAAIIIVVFLILYIFYRRIRKFTSGMGFGWSMTVAGDPTRKRRVESYIRRSSHENRMKAKKNMKKADKAESFSKRKKYTNKYLLMTALANNDERVAQAVTEGRGRGHGIRRSGAEIGRLVK